MFPKPGKKKKKSSRIIDPVAIERNRRTYCVYCGRTGCKLGVHHIKFRSQGGDDVDDNLICLGEGPGSCLCHEKAHNRIPGEFISADDLKKKKALSLDD